MKSIFLSALLSLSCFCFAEFSDHLRKDVSKKTEENSIKNIDFIYLINLDQRPEKLEKSLSSLRPFGIVPHRFSAIYGWDLSAKTINELGVTLTPDMKKKRWAVHFALNEKKEREEDFLTDESIGKCFFSQTMRLGAIGCSLSHLSVLQDAYNSGYETIWVLEDDIVVQKDPHLLSGLIDKLDSLMGKGGWDVLYTDRDSDEYFENPIQPMLIEDNDFESDLKGGLWFFWRPDLELSISDLRKRTILSDDFVKIGSRARTHSMIIRRSGMEKILNYVKKHHIFLAYDHEIATVPDIKLVNLRSNIVTFSEGVSDTEFKEFNEKVTWDDHKKDTLKEIPNIFGWYNPEKIEKVMESIKRKKPVLCVEIGSFGGSTTYSIARSLNFLDQGIVYAIDAWDSQIALEEVKGSKTIQWWKELNMDLVYQHFQNVFSSKQLEKYCFPIRKRSSEAVSLFKDESIDFLYMDGNSSAKKSLEDAILYFPKVKEGGYIWLNDINLVSKSDSIAFLFKNCRWIREMTLEDCMLFEKNGQK